MFENLRKYKNIIVSGCHRSGTTICAQMIASDLMIRFVDETEFNFFNTDKFYALLNENEKKVIQAPSMFEETMKINDKDTIIVYMNRDINDILKSKERLDITDKENCLDKLKVISKIPIVINYEDLSGHDLWLDKETRKDFLVKQTTAEDDNKDYKSKVLWQ